MKNRTCSIDGCNRAHEARGYCALHYSRARRHGDPLNGNIKAVPTDPVERLKHHGWSVSARGCWEFMGARDARGYGVLRIRRRVVKAHRLAYEAWVGTLASTDLVMHSCDNPPCINPEHLSKGTHAENMAQMAMRARSGKTKLSEDQVLEILSSVDESCVELARRFGVTQTAISRIRLGRTWRHLQHLNPNADYQRQVVRR